MIQNRDVTGEKIDRDKASSGHASQAIEVFPYGLSIGPDISRPVLIFQDEGAKSSFPVWLGPIEAAVALAYLDCQVGHVPYGVLTQLLEQLGSRLESCVLDHVQGHRQAGLLQFKGGRKAIEAIRRPADEIVSVGLTQKARFFATHDFIQRSREMTVELQDVEAHLKAFPSEGRKAHSFLM